MALEQIKSEDSGCFSMMTNNIKLLLVSKLAFQLVDFVLFQCLDEGPLLLRKRPRAIQYNSLDVVSVRLRNNSQIQYTNRGLCSSDT
jgi:hypothetical protein